jgi:hypothetical protein
MGKLNIKNGTPVGSVNLCQSCTWGQCITGYRESERVVICNKTSPDMVVPFVVLECTSYLDKYRPDWEQMQKLAIDIQPVRISSRTAGFGTLTDARSIRTDESDEEVDGEAASSE